MSASTSLSRSSITRTRTCTRGSRSSSISPDRSTTRPRSCTSTRDRQAIRTIRFRARRTTSSIGSIRCWRRRRAACISRAGSRRTSTTTWIRWWRSRCRSTPRWLSRRQRRLLMAPDPRQRLFDSFWIGGFEAATHVNRAGRRLDMIAATQHDRQIDLDYTNLTQMGIRTVRDAVRWHLIDHHGEYDFSSLAPMVAAAERHGIQVIWTLCHYGWPDDLDVFGPDFVPRFAAFASAVARFIDANSRRIPTFSPVNEISFFSWAAGEVGWFHPFGTGRGVELKRRLVEASIAACDAIWSVDRRARIVHVDP